MTEKSKIWTFDMSYYPELLKSSPNGLATENEPVFDSMPATPPTPRGLVSPTTGRPLTTAEVLLYERNGGKMPPKDKVWPETEPWLELLYNYTQVTTLHGVRFITEDFPYTIRRIVWFFFVSFSLGFYLYYTYDRISYYLQFKTNVNVAVEYLDKVDFPAITLCNRNAFRLSTVTQNGWYPMLQRTLLARTTGGLRQCKSSEFRCLDNTICIPISQRCDLFPDCSDLSDEQNCDDCPMFHVKTSHPSLRALDGVYFKKQQHTFNATQLYVQVDGGDEPFYLYPLPNGTWYLAHSYLSLKPFAWWDVPSGGEPAASPQGTSTAGRWTVRMAGDSTTQVTGVSFPCYEPLREVNDVLDTANASTLSIDKIYMEAAHQQDVFIQSCMWRGEPCHEDWIQPKITDMGVCYMFNSTDMFIEQSGPGWGLTVTTNIEYYEYTIPGEDGLGIKLLMHDSHDSPQMEELGVAVSPGLYSYIAMETTEVQNLGSPWGDCGSPELDSYPGLNYTLSLCNLECHTKQLQEECGCRLINMPKLDKNLPVCTVNNFMNCAKPELDQLLKVGNFCSCVTPCHQKRYVPTTSFSIVLSANSQASSEDESTAAMRASLQQARETRYRVDDSLYQSTLKKFHQLNEQYIQLLVFVRAVQHRLEKDFEEVSRDLQRSSVDCMMVRDVLEDVEQHLQRTVHAPVMDYRQSFYGKVLSVYDDLAPMLELWQEQLEQQLNTTSDFQDQSLLHASLTHVLHTVPLRETRLPHTSYEEYMSRFEPLRLDMGNLTSVLNTSDWSGKSNFAVDVDLIYSVPDSSSWNDIAGMYELSLEPLQLSLHLLWNIQQDDDTNGTELSARIEQHIPQHEILWKNAADFAIAHMLEETVSKVVPDTLHKQLWSNIKMFVDSKSITNQLRDVIPSQNQWNQSGGGADPSAYPNSSYFMFPLQEVMLLPALWQSDFVAEAENNINLVVNVQYVWDQAENVVSEVIDRLEPMIDIPTEKLWAQLIEFPSNVIVEEDVYSMLLTSLWNTETTDEDGDEFVSSSADLAAHRTWTGLQELLTGIESSDTSIVPLRSLTGNIHATTIPWSDFSSVDLLDSNPWMFASMSEVGIDVTLFPELDGVMLAVQRQNFPAVAGFGDDFWSSPFSLVFPMSVVWSDLAVLFEDLSYLRSPDPLLMIEAGQLWKETPDYTKAAIVFLEDNTIIAVKDLIADQDYVNITLSTSAQLFFNMEEIVNMLDFADKPYGSSALKMSVNPADLMINAADYNGAATSDHDGVFAEEYLKHWASLNGESTTDVMSTVLQYPVMADHFTLNALSARMNNISQTLISKAAETLTTNARNYTDDVLSNNSLSMFTPVHTFLQNTQAYVTKQRRGSDHMVYNTITDLWNATSELLYLLESMFTVKESAQQSLQSGIVREMFNAFLLHHDNMAVYLQPSEVWKQTIANVNVSLEQSMLEVTHHMTPYNLASPTNESLMSAFHTVANSLPHLAGGKLEALAQLQVQSPELSMFELDVPMLVPLLEELGLWCTWCVDSPNPLQALQDRLHSYMDSDCYEAYSAAMEDLRNISWILNNYTYTQDQAWKTKVTGTFAPGSQLSAELSIVQEEYKNLTQDYHEEVTGAKETMALLSASLKENLDIIWSKIQSAVQDSMDLLEMIDVMKEQIWITSCQVDLQQSWKQYENTHSATAGMLADIHSFVHSEMTKTTSLKQQYQNESLDLHTLANSINFPIILTSLQGKKVRVFSILNDHMFTLGSLEEQINELGYLFLATFQREHLVEKSAYWSHYNITEPGVILPGSLHILGRTVPSSSPLIVPDGNTRAAWFQRAEVLTIFLANMEVQTDNLQDVIMTAQVYFDDYVAGDELNQQFYSNNYLTVDLFMKELVKQSVSEQKAYEYSGLLSEVGGLMGLLLGASVLTVGEMVDLIVCNGIRKCNEKRKAALARAKIKPGSGGNKSAPPDGIMGAIGGNK